MHYFNNLLILLGFIGRLLFLQPPLPIYSNLIQAVKHHCLPIPVWLIIIAPVNSIFFRCVAFHMVATKIWIRKQLLLYQVIQFKKVSTQENVRAYWIMAVRFLTAVLKIKKIPLLSFSPSMTDVKAPWSYIYQVVPFHSLWWKSWFK